VRYSFPAKRSDAPGFSTMWQRRHGASSIRRHLWPLPTVSVATRTSPGRMMNVSPSRVVNSSVPASVMTYWVSGASCQSKLECGGDSLKCLLWVIHVVLAARLSLPVVPSELTFSGTVGMSQT
jgi:hypothetical protein